MTLWGKDVSKRLVSVGLRYCRSILSVHVAWQVKKVGWEANRNPPLRCGTTPSSFSIFPTGLRERCLKGAESGTRRRHTTKEWCAKRRHFVVKYLIFMHQTAQSVLNLLRKTIARASNQKGEKNTRRKNQVSKRADSLRLRHPAAFTEPCGQEKSGKTSWKALMKVRQRDGRMVSFATRYPPWLII